MSDIFIGFILGIVVMGFLLVITERIYESGAQNIEEGTAEDGDEHERGV